MVERWSLGIVRGNGATGSLAVGSSTELVGVGQRCSECYGAAISAHVARTTKSPLPVSF